MRILVWGAGFFGRKWIETVQARADCQVAGVISRGAGRAAELRRDPALVGVPAYTGLAEAAAGADQAAPPADPADAPYRERLRRELDDFAR